MWESGVQVSEGAPNAFLAQSAERTAVNRDVVGSSPTGRAMPRITMVLVSS